MKKKINFGSNKIKKNAFQRLLLLLPWLEVVFDPLSLRTRATRRANASRKKPDERGFTP
jgi:hypothetical protein